MLQRRAFLNGLLAVLYLTLVGAVDFSEPDFSWTPSYFDDDDYDLLPLVTKRVPIVTVEILTLTPVLMTSVAVIPPRPSLRPFVLAGAPRLRGPPLS